MKRRLISLLLALAAVLTLFPAQALAVDAANPFRDVKQGDWCYEAVQYVRVNGFFNGTTRTTFSPDGTMTRGMFVTVLGRAAGVDTAQYQGRSAFTDVPADAYFAPYVAWAAKHGVTTGTGDGKFSPYAPINRQQMAAFFVRYFEAFGVDCATGQEITTGPADMDSVSPYAREAVRKLWRLGLLNGDGVNFNPAGNATRAQTATLCWRLDRTVETWYKEPGVPSGRVKLDPATGLPYGEKPKKPAETKPSAGGFGESGSSGGSGGSGGSGDSGGGTTPSPAPSNTYSVRFYDGSRLVEAFNVRKGQPLGKTPSPEKASKDGAVLAGWYTDQALTRPFYADDPVQENLSVYARYEALEAPEEALTPSSYAQMDQSPDLTFRIRRVSGGVGPEDAASLKVMDGSEAVALSITREPLSVPESPDNIPEGSPDDLPESSPDDLPEGFPDVPPAPEELVCAVKGDPCFNRGCTYELTLAEGWVFVDEKTGENKPESIRTAAFSIKMEEVHNLRMNSAIKYVRDGGQDSPGEDLTFSIGGTPYDVLNSASVGALGEDGVGTFAYADSANDLREGDILCVYMGTRPDLRRTGAEAGDPAAYVKVRAAGGGTVTFGALDGEDQQNLYDIPDNFPMLLSDFPQGNTVSIDSLDTEVYALMMGAEEGTLEGAKARLSPGDFVTLYTAESFSRQEAVYGRVESIRDGTITYAPTTEDAMLHSMDLYDQLETADGGEWVSEDLQRELESMIQDQVEQSGFAEEAAGLLSDVVAETEGFRENEAVRRYLLYGGSARFGGGFTLANRPKVTVRLLTRGSELRFQGGVRLRVTLEAKYRVPLGETAQDFLVIDLDGSFIEEVALSPVVKAELVKEKIWFISAIKGVRLNAILDVKNYSAFDFNAEIYTADREGVIKGEKSRITSELENMGKTSSKAEYQESLSRLMERYTEVVRKDSDWVTLLEQKFLDQEKIVYGFCFGVKGHFVIQADMSLAVGSSLEYETGKRYIFWFKVGLFTPTSGSSVTDLIDERFGFQFYVMGRLGMKLGVKLKIYAGIGTEDFASAGLTAEVGPYLKLWGFFIYTCGKYRPASSALTATEERMAGALDLELGMYASVGYEATALKIFTYSDDFKSWEIPILRTGAEEFCYDCFYHPEPDESVRFQNNTGSSDGAVMKIGDFARTLKCITLENGYWYWKALPADRFFYTLSNSNFHLDTSTGELLVTVTPPEGVHYMKCDLTVTYKGGKMALSTYDMSTTVPLVWTDLTDRELKEYHTASVRVGNDAEGYNTVWTKKVLSGEAFDLPGDAKVRELAGWNSLKYEDGGGYNGQALEEQVITRDTVFDYNADLQTYSVTVTGVGGSGSKSFTAKYGEAFDFSELADTGGEFERFTHVTTSAEITVDELGGSQPMDLTRPIGPAMAQALRGGVTARAHYADDSVKAYFSFTGVDLEPIEVRTRRGTEPKTREVYDAVAALAVPNLAVRKITPAVGPIDGDSHFSVDCTLLSGARAELSFNSNGGPEAASMNRLAGSLVTNLPRLEKTGYTFEGWYEDPACESGKVEQLVMPEGGAVLYAKWTPNTYRVSFHVNGGTSDTPADVLVTYDGQYSGLPAVRWTGKRFLGWYTAPNGGEPVKDGDSVTITAEQTLYAHWGELLTIGTGDVFSVAPAVGDLFYNGQDCGGEVRWEQKTDALDSEGKPAPTEGYAVEFTGSSGSGAISTDGRPVNAGTYDLIITRPADDTYKEFREVHENVITIGKANWKETLFDTGKCTIKLVLGENYFQVHLAGDSGISLDEVEQNTNIPWYNIRGVYESDGVNDQKLRCKLLCFEGDPRYDGEGKDYFDQIDTSNDPSTYLPCTIILFIPENRNYEYISFETNEYSLG